MFVFIVVSFLGRYRNFRDSGVVKLCVFRGYFVVLLGVREVGEELGGYGVSV